MSGYEIVTGGMSEDGSDRKLITVTCPAGKTVIGGGARTFGIEIELLAVGASNPVPGHAEWFAEAHEISPTSSP